MLLSLVRTRAIGHLRDVRRLIVAMSRARSVRECAPARRPLAELTRLSSSSSSSLSAWLWAGGRLGLYIFGRKALLENTFELTPVVSQLADRPSALRLVLGEV